MFFAKTQLENAYRYRNAFKDLQVRMGPIGVVKKKGTWMIALDLIRLGRIGLFAASLFAVTGASAQQTPIKFSLDFKFEGPAAPFVVAIDKGYFKAEALDVTIDTATGSIEPINRVASATYDICFGDNNSPIKNPDTNPTTQIKAGIRF